MPYDAALMFDLVDKVEDYPKFLPWCDSTSVERAEGGNVLASMTVRKGPLRMSFTTANTHERKSGVICMRLVRGPFASLEGYWRFLPGEGGSRIEFEIDYSFPGWLAEKMFGPIVKFAYGRIAESFAERARAIYS